MGANAQTAVPDFTAGQVLTAAQMTEVNTGIPVFASSVERDAAFDGTGEKTLAEGQYAYLESTKQTLVYDGSNWVSVGVAPGLVLVKSQVIGTTVATVTVTDAFSATYDNYKIVVSGGTSSAANTGLRMILGATTTGYYYGIKGRTFAGADVDNQGSNAAHLIVGAATTASISASFDLFDPFATSETFFLGASVQMQTTGNVFNVGGFLNDTTSYTDFTFSLSTGTITGGTIRVYAYANS